MNKFNPSEYEKKWQEKWNKEEIYKTPEIKKGDKKAYILDMYPYPSGSGLHVGHPRGYLGTDVVARFNRMKGNKVLHPIGFDSFGLPAENYAIKTGTPPEESTNKAIKYFKEQIDGLGISYDWSREISSHDPEFMKWNQWIFLQLYKKGLAYKKTAPVNWDPVDQTVLANEQVLPDGTAERSGAVVEQKDMDQWFFKITDFADRLVEDLDKIDWPESTKLGQKNWIGRSEGAEINFKLRITNDDKDLGKLNVFTTRPDTIFGATFMVIAPEHEILKQVQDDITNFSEVDGYVKVAENKTDLQRQQQKEKTGVKLEGVVAINPFTAKEIPIYVADYVLGGYGTGAIMAVPAHDERDFEFAEKYDIEVIKVVEGEELPHHDDGEHINSDFLNGLNTNDAISKSIEEIEKQGIGKRKTTYRLRDWLVSRQRYWGCPIPVVYDPEGNAHPIAEEDLPLLLPTDVDYNPKGKSPLASSESFKKQAEEKYGEGWHYEVDTLDTFMDSSWYFFRFADPHNTEAFSDSEKLKSWLPVDLYVGGAEHTVLHLMYARFFTKFLFDEGYIDFDEPFQKLRHQGMVLAEDSRKMSKRWGNTIDPKDEIEKFGADTLRVYEMFMGPFDSTMPWDTKAEIGVSRFLSKAWDNFDKLDGTFETDTQEREINKLIKYIGNAIDTLSFNTAVAKFMEFNNFLTKEEKINKSVFERFLLILAPFAPYVTEELWSKLGNEFSIHNQNWPEYDDELAKDDLLTIGVQVNGKVRGTIEIEPGEDQESVMKKARDVESVAKYLEGEPKKIIYVQDKILNIIV